jgi:seryl-tRNA synthetase|tara:strand:+ start:246 stop:545 length:300 start_codon:yes stop_codon:yes gene_type:complete
MSESIKVPTWALPALGAAIAVAVSWGVLQANTANASEERARIEQIAEEAVKKAQKNGQAIAVTDQKVQAIVDSLSRQEKIQEQTNTQIQALVQALLNKS